MIRELFNKIRTYAVSKDIPKQEQDFSDLYKKPAYAHSDRLEGNLQDLYLDLGVLSEGFQEVVDEAKKREREQELGKVSWRETSTAA